MKYTPITSEEDALDRVEGLGFERFCLATYSEEWQRDQGEPGLSWYDCAEYAVEDFLNGCSDFLCVELRGIDPSGLEYPILIGGLADDLSEEGEFIE